MADLNSAFVQQTFTLRSENENRTHSITAKLMISGLVLNYLKEAGLVTAKTLRNHASLLKPIDADKIAVRASLYASSFLVYG